LELLDDITPQASMTGAVNVVRRDPDGRLVGSMVDGTGFVQGLRNNGVEPGGRCVLLMGAGGTARAIAFAAAGYRDSRRSTL
jgi:shikimate dehydrogenase